MADRANYLASHYLSWIPFMGGIANRISSATAGIPSTLREDPDALDQRISELLTEVLGPEKAAHLWDTNDGSRGEVRRFRKASPGSTVSFIALLGVWA
ncbi:hypothetical protein FOZ63_017285 [Perkinsus olseni]|uniref:Uncharacterized protein n=1 Tax=Perkinsus olseni TaxID=32597 RepID=A0A7J6S6Y6_PEROL|nr:hypothetical protein FOZ63_017285 [Perkinsus olseni]KAF4728425.1 hypothetical protein FOZ62_017101 [Perkinsus olseni]